MVVRSSGVADDPFMIKLRYVLLLLFSLTAILLISGCGGDTASVQSVEFTQIVESSEPATARPGDSGTDIRAIRPLRRQGSRRDPHRRRRTCRCQRHLRRNGRTHSFASVYA